MRFAFYTVCPSPHQYPLAKELVAHLGSANFRYISSRETEGERAKLGWDGALGCDWEILPGSQKELAREWLENADVLFSYIRDVDLFLRRSSRGLESFYCSERWFKPILVASGEWCLPGFLRMLVPSYRRMVKRFVAWANGNPQARVLAIGPWAKKDFLRMGVRADKIIPWGYFVSPSVEKRCRCRKVGDSLKVLWVGRDIPLKRVRDIERAVALANEEIEKEGEERKIRFTKLTGVPLAEVRKAMREHDTFVFASNGFEGWGAVVSEALEEGMNVVGTWECGAPPTLLPKERLYHCGDVKALAKLLVKEYRGELPACQIGEWTAKRAAERLVDSCSEEL